LWITEFHSGCFWISFCSCGDEPPCVKITNHIFLNYHLSYFYLSTLRKFLNGCGKEVDFVSLGIKNYAKCIWI
jgi:hypothetical protein